MVYMDVFMKRGILHYRGGGNVKEKLRGGESSFIYYICVCTHIYIFCKILYVNNLFIKNIRIKI